MYSIANFKFVFTVCTVIRNAIFAKDYFDLIHAHIAVCTATISLCVGLG